MHRSSTFTGEGTGSKWFVTFLIVTEARCLDYEKSYAIECTMQWLSIFVANGNVGPYFLCRSKSEFPLDLLLVILT